MLGSTKADFSGYVYYVFDLCHNETPGLSSVDLPTLARDAVQGKCFHDKNILYRQKENGELLRQDA